MKGKKAAQSANRRASRVLDRAEAAETALATERQQWRAREVELETELAALRFEMNQRIDQGAALRTEETVSATKAALNAQREDNRKSATTVLELIEPYVGPATLEQVASLLGVTVNSVMTRVVRQRSSTHPNRARNRALNRVSKRAAQTIAAQSEREAHLPRHDLVAERRRGERDNYQAEMTAANDLLLGIVVGNSQ
jgi:hypothetical protein